MCWEKYEISKMELFAKIVKGFQLSSKHILIMLMRRFVCPNSNCPNSSSERSSTLFHYLRCRFGTSFQMATSWNFVYCKAKEELLWVFSKVTVLFLWDNHGGTLQTWILQLSGNKPPLLRVFSTAFNEVFWNSYVVENSGTTTCDFENRVWLLICMNLPCQVDSWLSSFQNIPIWALTSEL